MRKALFLRCTSLLAVALGFSAGSARAEKWNWDVTPYLWASGVHADAEVNGDPAFGADVSFKDIVDKVDIAGMLHFEGRRSKAGFFTDLIFISLTDEQTLPSNPPLPGGTQVEADVDLGLYEAGGFYRVQGDKSGLDVLFGVRLTDLKSDLTFDIPAPISSTAETSGSDSYTDFILGLRYSAPLGKRWYFAVRGDAGLGETESAWNGVVSFGFMCDKQGKYHLRMGYRYFKTELDSENGNVDVETDMTLLGPYIGFGFVF